MNKISLNIEQLRMRLSFQLINKIISPFAFVFVLSVPTNSIARNIPSLIQDSPKEVLDQVWQIIYRDYMDSNGNFNRKNWIDVRKKLLSRSYDDFDHSYQAIRGMLDSLNDPYTRFLDPKEFKEMRIDTSGELTGIGIQISIDEQLKEVIVISPIEGTPAFKAGLKAKDIIKSIDGKLTKGMSINNVVKLIRGEKGSLVNIGILRNGNLINYSIERDRIKISSVTSRINLAKEGKKIAYIRLKQFSANAAKEMRNTIVSIEKKSPDAYIIDLRGNPGGLLEASIDISRQLLDKGIIVSTKTKEGITDIRRARGNALTKKPLAVLVNEGSASASEILSGAIQDNNRGILVGKKTFGKGLVQSVRPLADGSGLTVTVAKYLTPNGTDIHKNGINPDIEALVKLKNNKKLTSNDLGTKLDSQYVIAENSLLRNLIKNDQYKSYNPTKSNLRFALK